MGRKKNKKTNSSEKSTASDGEKSTIYDKLFFKYADKSTGLVEPEGIQSLCSDLGIDHTDIRILILAWKMKAQRQGYFTLNEWRQGLESLQSKSIISLRTALNTEKKQLNKANIGDLYSYSFTYCLTEDKQRTIDMESAFELLKLLLGDIIATLVNKLIEYLKVQQDYKAISKDQWMSFLRFANEINFPSLDNYDEGSAWPVLLDDFVDWARGSN